MYRSRLSAGGTRDRKEGSGLVRSNKGSRTRSSFTSSSSAAVSADSVASVSQFTTGITILAALISLLLVLVLMVGKGIDNNTNRLNTIEVVYHNITIPARFCLTPNNVNPSYIAAWMF